jgi:hypothetical protein
MTLRVLAGVVGAAVGMLCGLVIQLAWGVQVSRGPEPWWALPGYGTVVGGVTAALLGPTLQNADRVRVVAVGIVAGGLSVLMAGLLFSLTALAWAVQQGIDPSEIPAIVAGLIVFPIVYAIFGAPFVAATVPAGVAWAALTAAFISRGSPIPSHDIPTH